MNIKVFVKNQIPQLQSCNLGGMPRPLSIPGGGEVEITSADWQGYPGLRSKCKPGKVKGGGPLLTLLYRTGDGRDYPMTIEQADEWAKVAKPAAPEPPPFHAPATVVAPPAPFAETSGIPPVPPSGGV